MSDYERKLLGVIDKAFKVNEPTFGERLRDAGKTILEELYLDRKKDNAAKQALQLANSANTFNSIQKQLDDMYMAFPTEELDKVETVGEESFLNNYAEQEFNNTNWSQTTGIKWSDRTNPDRVTEEDKINMFKVYDAIKLNKKEHIGRLRQDPRSQMERTEFSQLVINAKNAEENRIKLNPETRFALPFISKSFDAMFGNGASAYTELEKASEKSQKELTEFIATLNGLDEKIAFDYGTIIDNNELSAEEKADMIRNETTSISLSSIVTEANKLESKLYRTDSKGKKQVREEVKDMIDDQPLMIPLVNYNRKYTIEDFKQIEPDQPKGTVPFNFYDRFLDNQIKVLNPDGTLSTSSNEEFLNIVAKNILERRQRAVADRDENVTMLLGTSGLNTVITSFANEGRFVLGSNIKMAENAMSPDLKIKNNDIVFISPSITNRINKDKISGNEAISEKDEQESSDGFDEAGFTSAAIESIQNGEIKEYQAIMLKVHPQHENFINKTVNNLLTLVDETEGNNLAEKIQKQETAKTIADVERPAIPFGDIASNVGDFFSNLQRETDFENLRDYVEKGDNAVIINRPALFKKYNLPANASPADVQKFLEEQQVQN
tara:strand:- start:1681 stop:3504 length:1824 start_codon:yes stop_codon:yes gene_type:complete